MLRRTLATHLASHMTCLVSPNSLSYHTYITTHDRLVLLQATYSLLFSHLGRDPFHQLLVGCHAFFHDGEKEVPKDHDILKQVRRMNSQSVCRPKSSKQ